LIPSQVHLPQDLVDRLADHRLTGREDLRLGLTLDPDLKHVLEDSELVSGLVGRMLRQLHDGILDKAPFFSGRRRLLGNLPQNYRAINLSLDFGHALIGWSLR
jgi:hypothetical protein